MNGGAKTRGFTSIIGHIIWNLLLLSAGSVICSAAINGILMPKGFLSTGIMGLSLVVYYLNPKLSLSILYVLFNIPLFAIGWRFVGRRFFLYSLAGMGIFALSVAWVRPLLPVEDKILSAILAGILTGIGSGLILRSQGSAGGTDILSVILNKWFSIRLGTTLLVFNAVILGSAAILFSLENALYTMIYIYVTSHALNLVVSGLSQRKAVFIISPKWDEISRWILREHRRGVTILLGMGGYTRQRERILYTVVTFRELANLKRATRSVDPNAFVVVTDTLEVIGHRIISQTHW